MFKVTATMKIDKRKLSEIAASIGNCAGAHTRVGVFPGLNPADFATKAKRKTDLADGHQPTTIAEYALVNEFGSRDGHIPERSFLRSTLKENRARYSKLMAEGLRDVLTGKKRIYAVFFGLGREAHNDIKRKITTFSTPADKPATIAAKGSSGPLRDTGAMRNSISWDVVEMTGAGAPTVTGVGNPRAGDAGDP